MFFVDVIGPQPVSWWDRNFIYVLYGIMAVTIGVVFFVLRRKDESSNRQGNRT